MKWSNMAGDDKRRFCEQCQLHVHNLSEMNETEQHALLLRTRERRCVTYEMQEGITPVSIGKWKMFQRLPRSWRRCAAVLATLLPMAFTQCSTPPPPPSSAASTTSVTQPCHHEKASGTEKLDGKMMITGVIAPPPQPLWRRILFFWES